MKDHAITHPVDRAVMNAKVCHNEWRAQHTAIVQEYRKPGRDIDAVIDCMADQILSLRKQLKVLLMEQP